MLLLGKLTEMTFILAVRAEKGVVEFTNGTGMCV